VRSNGGQTDSDGIKGHTIHETASGRDHRPPGGRRARVCAALAGQAPGAECVAADVERYTAWLAKYVYGVTGFGEYLDLCGGLSRRQELRRQELLLNQEG
jgi:hypothetical protein